MSRLPNPGSDDGTWGDILNTFLEVSHNRDGTLQAAAVIQAGGLTSSQVGAANGVAGLNSSTLVPVAQLGGGTPSSGNFLRGDGTWAIPAGSSGSSTLANDTDVSISSPSNNQVLTYDGTTSKWKNQAPTSAPVTSVFTRSGAVTAQSGDYTAAQVTNAADKSSASVQAFTGAVSAPALTATGLTGASAASRYVGATASGAPSSGTFTLGDFVIDQSAAIWVCATGGTPGAWKKIPTLDTTAGDIQALGTQAAGNTGKAADAGHVHPTTGLATLNGATFTGYVAPAVVALTDASTIALNAALGNDFRVTLAASHTLGNPTNSVDGQKILIQVTQGGSGSNTLSYGMAYEFSTSIPQPTLSTATGATDVLGFVYNAAKSKWLLVAFVGGFS